ncbi:DUF977 family protein [Enterobacter sp. WCHEn045836]|uniref:DUF977 family protein n=1 Tax=Enterobacter sp. WCHEn045836 TaxID=2497434 RepID=UPI00163A33D6|nr:DUF977 family protein [Enterobacter sp. WCHEn045836]
MACKLKHDLPAKIVAMVHNNGRITQAEVAQYAGITARTARRYLNMAIAAGNLYRSPKHGTFLSRQNYEEWLIVQGKKRQDALEKSEQPKFMMPYNPEKNIRCRECYQSPAMQRVLMFFNHSRMAAIKTEKNNG